MALSCSPFFYLRMDDADTAVTVGITESEVASVSLTSSLVFTATTEVKYRCRTVWEDLSVVDSDPATVLIIGTNICLSVGEIICCSKDLYHQ